MSPRALGSGTTLFLLLVFSAPPSLAATLPGTPMLLEIWVNGRTRHLVAPVVERNRLLFMKTEDVTASDITLRSDETPPCGYLAVNRLAGVQTEIVRGEQKLILTVAPDRLTPQAFDLRSDPNADRAFSDTGFIGSYNLVGTVDDFNRTGQTSNGGATLGGTLFTPVGLLSANGFTQTQTGLENFTRLDTTAEIDEPGIMRRWLFGDAVSGSLNWSRSVRFGGVQVGTDFSMRPDLNTMPLPAFFGQTAVPATVDVFVNSARVFETNVDSGPFQINNLPIITGNGQVSVVTRDVLGQQTTSLLPFYASNQLLRPGLESYDFDFGAIRKSYGLSSFDYGEPAGTATYSVGLNDWLTLESHGEASREVQLGGGGAIFSLCHYGVMHAAAAASTYNNSGVRQSGVLGSLSLENQNQPAGFFASISKTIGSYADIATPGNLPPPSFQTQIGANIGFDKNGSLALSWIETKSQNEGTAQLVSASYTLSFGRRWNLGVTSFYDVTNKAAVGEAILSVLFDDNKLIGHSSTRLGQNQNQEEVGILRPVSTDGGVGYQLTAAAGDPTTGLAEATWINSRGTFDGAFTSNNGVQSGRLTASGGIVAMDGSLYATQYPNGAVALIRTGQPNTRIYQENREVATTDADGEALLTNFTPFTANRISIDPRDYDLSSSIDAPQKIVVPRRQSGVIVDMTPEQHQPALIVLHEAKGAFPPMGARVTLDDNEPPIVVGRHGEVFIVDLQKAVKGLVEFDGGSCRFEVAPPQRSKDDPIPRLDPVACLAGQAS